MRRNKANKARGFTLIELMIVLVVVAILVAIAIPSYSQWARKAKRGDAQKILLNWANNQEIWRANNNAYAGTGDLAAPTSDDYDFAAVANANSFTLTATAKTGNGQNNDKEQGTSCSTMTLNQSGAKTPAVCWER